MARSSASALNSAMMAALAFSWRSLNRSRHDFLPPLEDDEEFVELVQEAQQIPQLQKPALKKLFAYFGETLEDLDDVDH